MRKTGWLAGLIVVMLLVSTACGNAPKEGGKSDAVGSAGGAESGKRQSIEIIRPGNNLPTPAEDQIKKKLEEDLGADYNMTVYASEDDYRNQLNVRLAGGNFPDLFRVDRQMLSELVKQGLVLDLEPYREQLKPVLDFIGDSELNGMLDGKLYAVSHTQQKPMQNFYIRKDWLDRLGLDMPKTLEDFRKVAIAFAQEDPDGNGKDDTMGLTGVKLDTFQPIFGAYHVAMPGFFYEKEGKLVNSLLDPAMKDALAYIKSLVDSKAVDAEFLGNTGMQHQQKAIMGQAGIVYIDWATLMKEEFMEQIKTVNPNAEWEPLPAPAGPGGEAYTGTWDVGTSPYIFAIPKALEKNPEKLQKVFDLLNYVSDQQTGGLLVQYGLEGKHYKLEGGKVVPTELMGKEMGYSWLYQFTGRPEIEYLQTKFPTQARYIDFYYEQPRIEALNGFVTLPESFNKSDADRYIEEQFAQFIYGKKNQEEYDAFLQTLLTTMNYQAYLDAAQQQLNAMGYGK